MRAPALRALATFLVLLPACSAAGRHAIRDDGRARAHGERLLPDLADAVRVVETRGEEELRLDELLDRLSGYDAVFVGETHLDDTTHRVELAVLEGMIARKNGRVVLSMEMFERDVQPVVDDYLAGRIDEATFLERSRPWGNYRTDYRPLVECARANHVPLVAANAPAGLRRKLSSGGRAALDGLAPEERRLLPAEILPADRTYWERVDRATRGHMNFASLPEEQRLYSGQNLWDNCMGDSVAQALAAHPGATVVHVVGGFHVMDRDGTAAQLARRAPRARVAVVEVTPVPGLFAARPERDRASADYLVYATGLARSLSDGLHAVEIPGEVRYSIDVPVTARDTARAPLVVWLPDGDERPADARAWLAAALGDEAAIAVVEPPYPQESADLAPGGRWSKGADFRADQGRVQHALERLVEYVTRRFPVSAEHVVVAGRGLGATTALWSAMYTEWLDARFLAFAPRGAGALRMEGLPDEAPVTRGLRLVVDEKEREGSGWIVADYQGVGIQTELVAAADASAAAGVEDELRTALGLAPRAPSSAAPVLCVLERDLPRARQWAEIEARRLERAGTPARVVTAAELHGDEDPARVRRLAIGGAFPLAGFAEGAGIPLAEGDFGGTTVLVVPAAASAEERAAWLALETAKALRKRSMFAGLRVAVEGGTPGLAQVLAELRTNGARSVLITPAEFCASPAEMRALWSSLHAGDEDWSDLDLAWLPGLGGELCTAEM